MKINKLIIKNYKKFKDITINMNDNINIFVGENDSGKSTILEALLMVLTGKINGNKIVNQLNLDWFNFQIRRQFRESLQNGDNISLPEINFEAYFSSVEDDIDIKSYRGTNNSLHDDSEGVYLKILFDKQYCEEYKKLLKGGQIKDIPIEYYKVEFGSFANPEYYFPATSKKVVTIDTTKKDYGAALNRFMVSSIDEYLSKEDISELRHTFRKNRENFQGSEVVQQLNQRLKESHDFHGQKIGMNLREYGIDEWKENMSILLDDVPLKNAGFGTQNMFKSEVFLAQNSDLKFLIIEEPENNLSYSNMSILISKLYQIKGKQLFISTHSSFVANKLGLQHLQLVSNSGIVSFKELAKEAYNYFLKLPGYNTLRLLLSKKTILVEGAADELIIQRAYLDRYGKLPIDDGVDVIAVEGVAFNPYCELARLIHKRITIVTDNDGNVSAVKDKYKSFADLVTLCVEENDKLNTLEPSVLNVNKSSFDSFDSFKSIIYCGKDEKGKNDQEILSFMEKNKTKWSMRVFESEAKINYPNYILDAIKSVVSETNNEQ